MSSLRKIISFIAYGLVVVFAFPQTNAEYQTQLAKAKEFEENKQYINALFCYYEAMNAEPTLKAEEAYNSYQKLLEEIENGKPGYGEFDDFTLYDGWYALCIEYEQFWTKHCPYIFDLKLVEDSKLLDMEKRTASYTFEKKRYETYFFTTVTEAIKKGMGKSRTKSWKGIPEKWPAISIYHDEKNNFMKNGVALFNITKDGESFFAPMFDSSYYELPNTYTYDSYGWKKAKYSTEYHSGSTLYDVKFDVTDKNGNLLFSVPRTLYDNGYKTEYSKLSFENLSPSVMKIIDSGEYEVKVTGLYLQYGRPAWNPSEERSSYTSENRQWMKGLPEITYDIEEQDQITSYSNSSESKVYLSKYVEESFIYTEGGTFSMGRWVLFGESNERPVHSVSLSPFYISSTKTTQKQWNSIMSSKNKENNTPVENISWFDAIVFCNKLSMFDNRSPVYSVNGKTNPDDWNYTPCQGNNLTGNISMDIKADGYRLPTEAEWEFAARKKNELSLNDIFGSVKEWCWDWYAWYEDNKVVQTDPTGPSSGNYRVLRGSDEAHRSYDYPSKRSNYVGFRLVHSRSEKEIALEKERKEQEKLEQERLEKERIEKERQEKERLEKERIEKERQEKERLEQKRIEQERLEQEILERERIEQERSENEQTIKNLSNSLVYIESGSFKMGSSSSSKDEKPIHTVTLSSYCMAQTEITEKQWRAVMGKNSIFFNDDDNPVASVSWYDAIVFCNKLSVLDNKTPVYSVNGKTDPDEWDYTPEQGDILTGEIIMNRNANGYRLPTEAEWEYAARGGNESKKYKYSGSNKIGEVAWYDNNSNTRTHFVAHMKSNELGLYDMSGNVAEWCWDWYGSYSKETQTNPTGPVYGSYRVTRGGSYYDSDFSCRVASRSGDDPSYKRGYTGFRVVRSTSEYETITPPIPVSNSVKQEEPVKKNDEITFMEESKNTTVKDIKDDFFPWFFSAGFQTPYENLTDLSFDLSEFAISASCDIHGFLPLPRMLSMVQFDFYFPEGFGNGFIPLMNLNLGLQFGWNYGLGLYGGLGCAIPGVVDDIGFLWKWTGGVRLVLNRVSFRGEISCLNNSEYDDKKYMIGVYIGFAPFHVK